MSKKIFNSIWLITLSVLIASLFIILGAVYSNFTDRQFEQLRGELSLAAKGISQGGMSYFDDLDMQDLRVTLITGNGTILYDNEADSSQMVNHLEREEIREAMDSGYGESLRYSDTLSVKQLYTAKLLPDGTVLRLSVIQDTFWSLLLHLLPAIILVLLLALILSYFLASRITNMIVRPLNSLDLASPMTAAQDPAYSEIMPLLERLEAQHRQIEKDHEELERTSLIRQEFTANASHELKTPLHVISGYAELLESGMVPEDDTQRFLARISAESKRMSKLVEDIIDLSSLDSGAADLPREKADLYRIALNAAESLEEEAEEAGIHLSVSGESVFVSGIPQVLYSMIYNLCINAIKYSERGGTTNVTVRKNAGSAVLTVEDNGIGIPREDLDRIFERFYRVDKSHSKEVGGTGLGLSIVKHGAKIHGADIHVESVLGAGSVFTLTFPLPA